MKPQQKPVNPNFSSGPCAKRPDWSLDNLKGALLGRSHRSGIGKARLKEVIELQRSLLGIPDDYLIGIVPASDTGAIEMALWSMLGARGVNALVTDSFSGDWAKVRAPSSTTGAAGSFPRGTTERSKPGSTALAGSAFHRGGRPRSSRTPASRSGWRLPRRTCGSPAGATEAVHEREGLPPFGNTCRSVGGANM